MLIAMGGQLYTLWCMIRTTELATNDSKQELSSALLKAPHKNMSKVQEEELSLLRCQKCTVMFLRKEIQSHSFAMSICAKLCTPLSVNVVQTKIKREEGFNNSNLFVYIAYRFNSLYSVAFLE